MDEVGKSLHNSEEYNMNTTIREHSDVIDELHAVVSELHKYLKPILVEAEEPFEVDPSHPEKDEDRPAQSPLVLEVISQTKNVRAAIHRLKRIVERTDIP